MNYWRKLIILWIVLFLTVFLGVKGVDATGINEKINFQGKVTNIDGTNVSDANYDFVFSIWNTATVGTSIWSEVWNGGNSQVGVSSGIFNVQLGTYTSLSPVVDFNNPEIYLSVNFKGDGDMAPRIQMTAVPYAFNAEKVGGLTVTSTDGVLTIGDSKTIVFGDNFTTIEGVGITLDQNLSMGSTVVFAGLSIGGSVAFSNIPVGTGTTILYIGAGGKLVQGTLPAGGSYTASNGLSLAGTVFSLGGTLTDNTQIGVSSFSLTFLGINNTQALFVGATGYVGIGTTNPIYKLEVVGDAMVSTKLGVGGTGVRAFNVLTDANIGTNLAIGGSLSLTALPIGIGTSILYIDENGNVSQGTLPVTSIANSKIIVLSPEYPGASLSADGSGTTSVSMTSDNTLNSGGVGWKNYYELTSAEASLQDYSVVVRVTLPSDFASWETGACPDACALEFKYQTGLSTTADNAISYKVTNDLDTPGSDVCSVGSTASTGWGSSGCVEGTLNDGSAPEWDAPGETAVIRIKMAAKNTGSAFVRAGDIIMRYKSRF